MRLVPLPVDATPFTGLAAPSDTLVDSAELLCDLMRKARAMELC
jgi:hypothetical protein